MSLPRSSTSHLPVFGIRNLTGPENPPGLISITSREYDSTIQSEPSATLLYLDEDDGELITVGSAIELSQRLEEPVPRSIQTKVSETRNPLDGQLVHVFDINRTLGSLMVWTDHEAYSSKELRRSVSPSEFSASPFADPVESVLTLRRENSPSPLLSRRDTEPISEELGDETQKDDKVNMQTTNILDGVEEHLNGLANVLQIAATTLQKAANKTKDTDTSVVEDILKGVKNILTEVGSFGLEAYKAFEHETSETPSWISSAENESWVEGSTQEPTLSGPSMSEPKDLILNEAEPSSTKPVVIADTRPSRVKFAASVVDVVEEAADPMESPIAGALGESVESFSEKRKRDEMGECVPLPPVNQSILDDGNEDADFTARYPPLMSIRRAHTVSGLYGRENLRGSRRGEREIQPLRHKSTGHQNTFPHRSQNLEKPDGSEPVPKPIPGAWPNLKNEPAPAPPTSGESSGAFFNRVTGRDGTGDISSFGLHRANTTTASNPASRLNGPFDPVSAYQSTDLRSSEAPFRPRRPFVNSSRARYQPPWAQSAREDSSPPGFNAWRGYMKEESGFKPWKDYMKEEAELGLRSKRSMPAMRHNSKPVFDDKSKTSIPDGKPVNSPNSDSHRTVKHHRSVPQFHGVSPQLPTTNDIEKFWPWSQSNVDILTGPTSSPPPPPGLTASSVRLPEPYSYKLPDVHSLNNTPPVPFGKANLSTVWNQSQPLPFPPPTLAMGNLSYGSPGTSSQSPVFSTSAVPFHPSMSNDEAWVGETEPSSDFSVISSAPVASLFEAEQPQASLVRPTKNKFDRCVEHLKILGFGTNDSMVRDRLHVYAVAADGDVTEAVEMIEEDRRVSGTFC